jgi:hypothetical protein
MSILKPLLGFIRLDHRINSDFREKFEATDRVEEIQRHQQKW